MAILLLERRAGLEQFTDEVVNRDDVQALIRKVHFGVDPEAEARGHAEMTTIITVHTTSGEVLRTVGSRGRGHPGNPMSDAELVEKFSECAAWGGCDDLGLAREGAASILSLEDEPSVRALMRRLATSLVAPVRLA